MSAAMPRVLLVDDSPNVRSLLGVRLREAGFEVEEAPDAIVGAELAIERPPNVVVTSPAGTAGGFSTRTRRVATFAKPKRGRLCA
jgi:DNA-binding NtrC family response regulator